MFMDSLTEKILIEEGPGEYLIETCFPFLSGGVTSPELNRLVVGLRIARQILKIRSRWLLKEPLDPS